MLAVVRHADARVTWLLTLLGALLVPLNAITMVATRELATARDRWLLAVLTLVTVWLAWQPGLLWLALIALWHLARWRDPALLGSVVMWAAIGATWALLRSLPPWAFDVIAWGWVAGAVGQVGFCLWSWRVTDWSVIKRPSLGRRVKGTLGSPVLTAFYFTLTAPFTPWWLWPMLGVGFYLTCSWSALIGLAVAGAWMWPLTALPVAAGGLAVAMLGWWSPVVRGQRLLEWLPRGDSVDGWLTRWTLTRLLLWHWWTGGHRWLGHGPQSTTRQARLWGSRTGVELPNGEGHCDIAQTVYEMGLLGAFAMLAFGWPILSRLTIGDPWSASWIALIVISLGHWPLRHPILGLMFLVISARLVVQ